MKLFRVNVRLAHEITLRHLAVMRGHGQFSGAVPAQETVRDITKLFRDILHGKSFVKT